MSSLTDEGAGLEVTLPSPYLDVEVFAAPSAAGALEEGFVWSVLLKRFLGMNLNHLSKSRPRADKMPVIGRGRSYDLR